ncbi:hypothetical protein P1P70_23055 [Streptomyces sp. MB09-02B]|nr:hypothetical protein [Streptomyces sp. MB09-02B]
MLFPGDGDTSGPDVGWSYGGFAAFRARLAQAEGFTLSDMWGFGGERPWNDVSTPLKPLLDRPDDGGGELSAAECAAMLARLDAITDEWRRQADDPLLRQHAEDAGQLAVVLRRCVEKGVGLLFL